MGFAEKKKTRTTTVRLPRSVYDQVICVVEKEKGVSGSASLNDFFVAAIEAYLRMYRRRQIDAAFAGMAEDSDYQEEAKFIAEEFWA
jgi:conjugal transfer/entry exclusion protein